MFFKDKLFCLIFNQNQLKQVLKDSGNGAGADGRVHLSFRIIVQNEKPKATQIRGSSEVDVDFALNNYKVIKK